MNSGELERRRIKGATLALTTWILSDTDNPCRFAARVRELLEEPLLSEL